MALLEPVTYSKAESSLIREIQYNDSEWILHVVMHNSNGYHYQNFPPEEYDAFLMAPSKGSFYNKNVKGRYESLNDKDLPVEMPKTIDAKLDDVLPPPAMDDTWPPRAAFDAVAGADDALEIAGSAAVEPEVLEPEVALVTTAPLTEVMSKLSSVSTQLAALNKKSLAFISQEFAVTDRKSYDEVQTTVKLIKSHGAEIVALVDPIRDVFFKAYSAIQGKQKEATEPLNIAMKTANAALNAYDDKMAAEARERQRIADKAAADAAEAARRAESERLTLAAVEDKLAEGDTKAAEMLFADPIEAPAQPIYSERVYSYEPEVKGVSKRKNWKGDVLDIEAIIIDVAEGIKCMKANGNLGGHAPANFLTANGTSINQVAKALESNAKFPGIRFYNDAVRATRA